MLSDIKQAELDLAEEKILVSLFGSTEPSAKAQWLMNFLGIKINDIIKEFEYIVKPMMNEQGLVNGAMAKAILADKYPLFAKIVPENDFRLADVAEPVSNVIKAIKERAI